MMFLMMPTMLWEDDAQDGVAGRDDVPVEAPAAAPNDCSSPSAIETSRRATM
jgi:hypothetical protein